LATERVERRLAAILAADIAGYSRLMGADEEDTLARLRTHRRELIDPKINEHRGRIVKTTGDGILIEFPSVIEAISCAVAVQREMAERNAGTPEESRIIFRIGVNLGDIIVEDGDIHGDGVNIAARLEGIAEPGGICVSEDAFRQVRGKVDAEFEDIGEQRLKNIARPLRVYRVLPEKPTEESARALPLPDKPSIAVLPFANMSGDPEQEYFADGMVEEIITALSRIRWLFVIARNLSFTYKGRSVDVKQVRRELGVRYVLEGSVRKAANRVRITAQLIEAATGTHVWAERYDRSLDDIFACRMKSPSVRSVQSSRASGTPRLSASSVSGPTILVPTTWCCARCPTPMRRCRKRRASQCRCSNAPSPSSPIMASPMVTSLFATRSCSRAADTTRRSPPRPYATPMRQSRMAATTPPPLRWEGSPSRWSSMIAPLPSKPLRPPWR